MCDEENGDGLNRKTKWRKKKIVWFLWLLCGSWVNGLDEVCEQERKRGGMNPSLNVFVTICIIK